MPYLKQSERDDLDPLLEAFFNDIDFNALPSGRLNYILTRIVMQYVNERRLDPRYGDATIPTSYATINSVMGVLTCVQQEFYRRIAVPFEEGKAILNGDVYKEYAY